MRATTFFNLQRNMLCQLKKNVVRITSPLVQTMQLVIYYKSCILISSERIDIQFKKMAEQQQASLASFGRLRLHAGYNRRVRDQFSFWMSELAHAHCVNLCKLPLF